MNGDPDRHSPSSLTGGPHGLGRAGLAVILSAQLVVTLDFSIVNVALPSISSELHASSTAVQWIVTAYAITFGGLLVLGGRAADLFGRRRLFMAGLAGFAVASAAAGLATSFPLLVVARAVQRRSGGGRGPRRIVDPDHHFPRRAGQNSCSWLLRRDGVVGFRRRAGGGWRARRDRRLARVFFVNVPVCLIGVAVSHRVLHSDVPTAKRQHLDLIGAVLVTAGVATLVYALVPAPIAVDVRFFPRRPRRRWRASQPVCPPRASQSPAAHAAVDLPIANAGRRRRCDTSRWGVERRRSVASQPLLPAGARLLPASGRARRRAPRRRRPAARRLRQQVLARLGMKWFLTSSAALAAIGLALLLRLPATSHYPLLGVVLLLVGFGTTSTIFAATVAGTAGITDAEQGLASALVNTARQVGAAIGVATLLAVAAAESGSRPRLRPPWPGLPARRRRVALPSPSPPVFSRPSSSTGQHVKPTTIGSGNAISTARGPARASRPQRTTA